MSNKIQVKRGLVATIPILSAGEPAFTLDAGTEQFYVGNGSANIQLARKDYVDTLSSKVDDATNPLSVTLTLTPATAETGSTVISTVANWTCSKAVASQTFEGATIDVALRTKTYATPLTANKTFTIIDTTSGGTAITKTATLTFSNGIYYGKSSSVTYNSALITSLTKVLSDTRGRTVSVTAGEGEYIYYALPTRLGTPTFTIGGFSGGVAKVATITFTNPSGYAESYDIYRSDNANLGTLSITIS